MRLLFYALEATALISLGVTCYFAGYIRGHAQPPVCLWCKYRALGLNLTFRFIGWIHRKIPRLFKPVMVACAGVWVTESRIEVSRWQRLKSVRIVKKNVPQTPQNAQTAVFPSSAKTPITTRSVAGPQ